MKVGLQFIDQVRSLRIPSPDPVQDQLRTFDERSQNAGGGWIAQQFEKLIASVAASYHREHNDNDTHSTITATGSITERQRELAIGEWYKLPLVSSNFTGSGTMTWTTIAGAVRYTLLGDTMTVSWYLDNTTVGGGLDTALKITLPGQFTAVRQEFNPFAYADNGVVGIGVAQMNANNLTGVVIQLFKDFRASANWSASAAATGVGGQITFQVRLLSEAG